jgi:hypothetical protein
VAKTEISGAEIKNTRKSEEVKLFRDLIYLKKKNNF